MWFAGGADTAGGGGSCPRRAAAADEDAADGPHSPGTAPLERPTLPPPLERLTLPPVSPPAGIEDEEDEEEEDAEDGVAGAAEGGHSAMTALPLPPEPPPAGNDTGRADDEVGLPPTDEDADGGARALNAAGAPPLGAL